MIRSPQYFPYFFTLNKLFMMNNFNYVLKYVNTKDNKGKNLITFLILCFLTIEGFCQAPGIEYKRSIGSAS